MKMKICKNEKKASVRVIISRLVVKISGSFFAID